jgi:hypothetical protein
MKRPQICAELREFVSAAICVNSICAICGKKMIADSADETPADLRGTPGI